MNNEERKTLWEVAVLLHNDDNTTLLVSPKCVVARSQGGACYEILRELKGDYDFDHMEIMARPFGGWQTDEKEKRNTSGNTSVNHYFNTPTTWTNANTAWTTYTTNATSNSLTIE